MRDPVLGLFFFFFFSVCPSLKRCVRQCGIIGEWKGENLISERDIIREADCRKGSSLFHPVYFQNRNAKVLWSYHLRASYYLNGVLPLLARNGHGGAVTACPLLGVKRKTSARSEYFV